MAKLADITSEIRIILKILGAALIVVAILFIFFKGAEYYIMLTTPPAPPEEKFGQLPAVSFNAQIPVNLKYRINTLTGKLPTLPDRMKVYKVENTPASLVALATTKRFLESVGYDKNETKISEAVYRWADSTGNTIQYNIVNNTFKISSNFLGLPPPLRLIGDAATKEGAYRNAISFLESINENTEDIDLDNSKVTYLKIAGGRLAEATSQDDAQFIRIDLFQKDLSGKKIYYPAVTQSPMYFIFRNENDTPKIVGAGFFHYTASSNSSDYTIKTAEAAFEDLVRGNAHVFVQNPLNGQIDITEVETGYYVSDDPQYFIPIVVFKGSAFTAFVNALPSQ